MNSKRLMAMAVVGIMIASGLILLIPTDKDQLLTSHISTITGDTYSGSGNWIITNPTVYTGETFAVAGNIYINGSGSLSLLTSVMTMTLTTQFQRQIYVNAGYFKASYSTLRTSTSTSAQPWVNITASSTSAPNIYISNSTLKHYDVKPHGSGDWIDNCTFHASAIDAWVGASYQTRINISYNDFDGLTWGRAITGGFSLNSNITGNNILPNCSQTYSPGSPGWINILGPFSGQSRGTSIIKNNIQAAVNYVGIYAVAPSKVYISRNTIDQVYRTNSVAYRMTAGIWLVGEGSWSSIDNNTIKHVTGNPLIGGYTGFNLGIAADTTAKYWNILYNGIWRVGSAENNSCFGIDYEGSHAEIKGNNFTFVGVDQGPVYVNTAGIMVENNFHNIYDPAIYYNVLNCEYVNSTYNVVETVSASSNGITYGWSMDGHNTTKGIVAHNTIGTTVAGSGGIGIYIHVSHIQVLYNTITAVNHDSYGIGVAADAKYITVSSNSIHVVSLNLVNYGGDYYGEGVSAWAEGAIMMGSETFMDTLEGCVFSYNHIVVDDRSNAPAVLPYNDYVIHYCAEGNPKPIFIVNEVAHFAFVNSTLEVRAELPGLPAQFTLNGVATTYNQTPHQSVWYSNTANRSYSFLNVTPGTIRSSLLPVHQYVTLIIVFIALAIALTVIGVATQSKGKELKKEDLVELVIGVVISLIMLGVLVTVIGS